MPRHAETQLEQALDSMGAVLIEGCMGVGKSTLCSQRARRVLNLQTNLNERELVETAPEQLLNGPYPTLIDEWQSAPNVWNQVRTAIDEKNSKGLYMLTGSATPRFDETRHPGVGRIARIKLRPLTLQEAGYSDGSVSLTKLTLGLPPQNHGSKQLAGIDAILEYLLRGGFPEQQGSTLNSAQNGMRVFASEIPRLPLPLGLGSRRSFVTMEALLNALARQIGSTLVAARLQQDMIKLGVEVDAKTISDYLNFLERLFIIERVPVWLGNLRSRIRINQTDKFYFVDPAIPAALLRADKQSLYADLQTAGFLFETLAYRELAVLAEILGARIFHYRDKANLEVDFVLRLENGSIAPIEIKLGTSRIPDGIKTLQRFAAKVDTDATPIAFKAILTSGQYSYLDQDSGTWIISAHHLGI